MLEGRPIKLLYLTISSTIGGTESILLQIISRLPNQQFKPFLVTFMGPGDLLIKAGEFRVRGVNLNMKGKWEFWKLSKLLAFVKAYQPDIVHSFLYEPNQLNRVLRAIKMVKSAVTSQESVDDWRKWYHNLGDKVTYRWADYILANCPTVKQRLIELTGIPSTKIKLITYGVDTKYFCPPVNKDQARKRLQTLYPKVNNWDWIAIMVANLTPHKNHSQALQALALLRSMGYRVGIILVGSGPREEEIRAQVGSLGLVDNVVLTGLQTREQIAQILLPGADVFILTSLWEGIPVSLLEAMACGLPVVANEVGGISEILNYGEFGKLVEVNHHQATAEAIKDIIDKKDKYQHYANLARKRIVEKYSFEYTMAQLIDLYRDLAGKIENA